MRTRVSARRLASLWFLALATIAVLMTSGPARAQFVPTTVYVNAANPTPVPPAPPLDGSSWAQAYNNLDTAIVNALPGSQIWVQTGTYIPGNPQTGFLITIQLKLYGGFAGDETSLAARHGSFSRTILEGNNGTPPFPNDDCWHVVTIQAVPGSSGNPGVLIDGFAIAHGRAIPTATPVNPMPIGGGIWSTGSDIDLANCFVQSNTAASGGGLFFTAGGGATWAPRILRIKNSQFTSNSSGPGGFPGFTSGGAIFAEQVTGEIVNTEFRLNSTTPQGGAVYLWMTGPGHRVDFTNNVFYDNQATGGGTPEGGAVYLGESALGEGANARFVNCTFAWNSTNLATGGEAMWVSANSQCEIYNSIIWDNAWPAAPIVGNATVAFSDVEQPVGTTYPGFQNMNANPRFRSVSAGNLRLSITPIVSPCIDAADYGSLPPDNLDVDGDGNITQVLPIDLDVGMRLIDLLAVPDTGNGSGGPTGCPTCTYLDMGAYERP